MPDEQRRANYVLLDFMEFLGDDPDALDVPWAEFTGNRTDERAFAIPTDDPSAAYVTVQAFDVGVYGHEILLNGEPVSGFDVPPADGWQLWMDAITGAKLVEGENTIRFARDRDSDDGFVVGTVAIHWKEPVG